MNQEPLPAIDTTDGLHWSLRLGGLVVLLLSGFLLVKNLGFGIGDDIFCGFSLSLGALAFAASWLPER